jgi:hypothetical protein
MTATNGAATPLSRYGTRVPTVTPRKGRTPAPAANTTASTAASATRTVVTPTATINVMIVCLPDGIPSQALTATHLGRHFGVSGTLQPRFWATPAMWAWQRGQLVAPRKGRPVYCAGGPVKLIRK